MEEKNAEKINYSRGSVNKQWIILIKIFDNTNIVTIVTAFFWYEPTATTHVEQMS